MRSAIFFYIFLPFILFYFFHHILLYSTCISLFTRQTLQGLGIISLSVFLLEKNTNLKTFQVCNVFFTCSFVCIIHRINDLRDLLSLFLLIALEWRPTRRPRLHSTRTGCILWRQGNREYIRLRVSDRTTANGEASQWTSGQAHVLILILSRLKSQQ